MPPHVSGSEVPLLNEDDSLGLNRLVIDGVSQLLVYLGGTSVWSAD
jgi:hypothetical protein